MPESPTPKSQSPTPKPEQLTETILDWRATTRIEQESRAIRNVALSGTKSQNGYRYTEAALRQAAPLYERVPVFLDHPASVQQPRSRSTRDLAGRVRNVRFEEERLRGDLETFDTEAGRTLLALAESDGPGVGMSHVVLAERSPDGATVRRIVDVVSVDAVVFPATTRTFHEAIDPANEPTRDFDSQPRGLAQAARTPQDPEALPGSLERLVATIDHQLPEHVQQLAVAAGLPCPGQGRRLALFPRHIVVEWRGAGFPARRVALPWRLDAAGVRFGKRFRSLAKIAEQDTSWRNHLGANRQKIAAQRETICLESRPTVTSHKRRATNSPLIDDARFVRTVRGR